MGDIPSRSFDHNKFTKHQDTEFLAHFARKFSLEAFPTPPEFLTTFAHQFPLEHFPQNVSWRLLQPRAEIVSAAILLLRGQNDLTIHPATSTGHAGVGLPVTLANTLSSLECRPIPSIWNEQTCSWPLLLPSGKEATSEVVRRFQARRSRKRFAGAPNAWSPAGLETLAEQIQHSTV